MKSSEITLTACVAIGITVGCERPAWAASFFQCVVDAYRRVTVTGETAAPRDPSMPSDGIPIQRARDTLDGNLIQSSERLRGVQVGAIEMIDAQGQTLIHQLITSNSASSIGEAIRDAGWKKLIEKALAAHLRFANVAAVRYRRFQPGASADHPLVESRTDAFAPADIAKIRKFRAQLDSDPKARGWGLEAQILYKRTVYEKKTFLLPARDGS